MEEIFSFLARDIIVDASWRFFLAPDKTTKPDKKTFYTFPKPFSKTPDNLLLIKL